MDSARVAEIQVVLEGVRLPASRRELVAYARRYDAEAATVLSRLPERSYDSIDDAAEQLLRTQPSEAGARPMPAPVSGQPPGGADYTNPSPEPGEVRSSAPEDNPPSKTLRKQSQTQKRQAAVQQAKPLPGPLTSS
jgi:hypothetical protein